MKVKLAVLLLCFVAVARVTESAEVVVIGHIQSMDLKHDKLMIKEGPFPQKLPEVPIIPTFDDASVHSPNDQSSTPTTRKLVTILTTVEFSTNTVIRSTRKTLSPVNLKAGDLVVVTGVRSEKAILATQIMKR